MHSIMSACPQAVCGLACGLVQRLSSIVRQMDFALDWMELEAGRALYRQGDEANAAFIILNGRVRSVVRKSEGKKELVDEYGRGETIGLVSSLTHCSRHSLKYHIAGRNDDQLCLCHYSACYPRHRGGLSTKWASQHHQAKAATGDLTANPSAW